MTKDLDLLSQLWLKTPHIASHVLLHLPIEQIYLTVPSVCKRWSSFVKSDFFVEQFLLDRFERRAVSAFLKSQNGSLTKFRRILPDLTWPLVFDLKMHEMTLPTGLNNACGVVDIVEALKNVYTTEVVREREGILVRQNGTLLCLINLELLCADVVAILDNLQMPMHFVTTTSTSTTASGDNATINFFDENLNFLSTAKPLKDPWTWLNVYPKGVRFAAFMHPNPPIFKFVFPEHAARQKRALRLRKAILRNDQSHVEKLLDPDHYGVTIDKHRFPTTNGQTAIDLACSTRRVSLNIVKTLLENGAALDGAIATRFGGAFERACALADVQRVRLLLQHESSSIVKAPSFSECFMKLLAMFRFAKGSEAELLETVKVMVKRGADVNLVYGDDSALMMAISKGYLSMARFLIDQGADVGFKSTSSRTALSVTLDPKSLLPKREDRIALVQLLLARGAPVNLPFAVLAESGRNARLTTTPLIEAVKTLQDETLVRLLLKSGADVDLADGRGSTALKHAYKRGDIRMLLVLLNKTE